KMGLDLRRAFGSYSLRSRPSCCCHRVGSLSIIALPLYFFKSTRAPAPGGIGKGILDRKSTRLNSSHVSISYAVFCLKKKMRNIVDEIQEIAQNNRSRLQLDFNMT